MRAPLVAALLAVLIGGCGRSGPLDGGSPSGFPIPGWSDPSETPGPSPTPPPAVLAPQCEVRTEPGLVGCWDCDGDCNDRSVYTHPFASLSGVAGAAGAVGSGSVELDASDDFVVASNSVFSTSNFTIEAWVWLAAAPSATTTIFHRSPTFWLRITANGALQCVVDDDPPGENVTSTNGAISAQTWTHVACTVDEGNFRRVYIDGVMANESGGSSGPSSSSNDLYMGQRDDGSERFTGRLDAMRIWNLVRSDAEICDAAGLESC